MDSTKLILIFGISLLIYFAFMFLGFFLKNKNLKAQNLNKEEYISKLMPKIKTIFEMSINDFFLYKLKHFFAKFYP